MVDIPAPELIAFDDERWYMEAQVMEKVSYLGADALKLQGGAAILPELDVANAVVEFDIATNGERGFAGLVFRFQDRQNFENFYIRPHQSGNPDANQYQPVYNGVAAWQLYHGEGFSAPVEYRNDEWMRVKVVFAGSQARVYIDSDEPVLMVDNLMREERGGSIGLQAANFAPVHFANFRYMKLPDAFEFVPASNDPVAVPDGLVTQWDVSDAFDRDSIASLDELPADLAASHNWTSLQAGEDGITNMAQVQGLGEGANTAFARTIVTTDEAQTMQLKFGYSDSAIVFVNGKRVYSGDNTYMSRDYRYLGTIGLFDNVPLDLQPGSNEICIAVTESFGGWGLIGAVSPASP